ncbi:MAG: hypothetical protein Fur0037_03230 [Planctomycetota bacterium]
MPPSILVLAAGVLFSLGGTLVKLCAFPSLERAGLRALIAASTLFLLLPAARRRPSRKVLLLLVPYFCATCLYVIANSLTTAANTIFLQSTAPVWVAALSPVLLRERPRREDIWILAAVGGGMAMIFAAPDRASATAPDPALGDAFALAAGVGYGVLLIGLRGLGRTGGEAGAVAAYGNLFTGLVALSLLPVFGQQPTAGDATSWLSIAMLGIFQVGLAYALLARAVRDVPALRASLLLMIEPALNPLLAFAVHGEKPPLLALAGGGVIVLGVAAAGIARARDEDEVRR